MTDAVTTLGVLFVGSDKVTCYDAADANDDGELTLTDSVLTLQYLFSGVEGIAAPGPDVCGWDVTDDTLDCNATIACTPGVLAMDNPLPPSTSKWWLEVFGYTCERAGVGGWICEKCETDAGGEEVCSEYVCNNSGDCEEMLQVAPGIPGTLPVETSLQEVTVPRDSNSGLPTGKRQHKPLTFTRKTE